MIDTKRVDELEVGDIVVTPYEEGNLTISCIEHLGRKQYRILFQELDEVRFFDAVVEVTYLGNNKEKKAMSEMNKAKHTQKVDCSALYPYFDSLANEEVTLKHTNVPVYVKQQLKNIHELFEGILGFTLEEVKTLYFERKMGKQKGVTKTKKVYELVPGGDVVIEPNCSNWGIISRIEIANKERGVYRVFYETDFSPNLGTYKHTDTFTYLHNISELENKSKIKKAKELQPGDKVVAAITEKILTVSSVKEISHVEIVYKELEGKTYTTHLDNEYTLVN